MQSSSQKKMKCRASGIKYKPILDKQQEFRNMPWNKLEMTKSKLKQKVSTVSYHDAPTQQQICNVYTVCESLVLKWHIAIRRVRASTMHARKKISEELIRIFG